MNFTNKGVKIMYKPVDKLQHSNYLQFLITNCNPIRRKIVMKHMITKTIGLILALAIIFAGIPCTETQAATAKPVIGSSQVTIKNNSCTIETGKKVKLTAKSSKKNVTTKGIWKSSKKSVATVSKKGVLAAKKTGITYITVKYKGKTSNKLKVIVKK
ncbi:MAG TPA: hypothetical protein DDY31_11485, partial [Lachnospiraceae bacterium]|nr:hypothetical protein [Lachnospiraceae bacterium]